MEDNFEQIQQYHSILHLTQTKQTVLPHIRIQQTQVGILVDHKGHLELAL